jgi:hypothetical protein
MGLTSDLRRRRAGLHQHREQSSPPKPQPRVAAGPAIRAVESEISSDSIRVVDSAVASLEIKSPLSTMLCYRRAQPTVEKTFADLVPARRGMRPRRNFQWAERFYRRRSEAVRGAIRDITAKQDNETQRGWSSFADTRQITFSNTIGEDHRIRHFLAAVCRRGGHPVGVRRHLNNSRIFGTRIVVPFSSARAETRFDGGWRLWNLGTSLPRHREPAPQRPTALRN